VTLTAIRAALEQRGLRPLKQFGQNFLHDQNLAARLAADATAGLPSGARVVEIGPGLGSLTAPLLALGFRVTALEKDRGLCEFLREHFSREIAAGQLELHEGDALERLPACAGEAAAICGNLPYYISTPLLMESLRLGSRPLFFVVQKEVGQRVASPPGGKIYGALSVIVQAACEVTLVRTLPGSVFYPPPEIESIAVRLVPRAQPLVAAEEMAGFIATVQRGFAQRRKKLSNLLPTDDARRAEHLSPEEWVGLWRGIGAAQSAS
jgi:16S rRNA (adenine1518-N6/adenine1519-N6)-dimethyltransferase